MTIIKSNLGEFPLLVTLNNREVSKLLRVFIKNTLIFDYENTMQAGQLADLASLLTLFCKHKQTVSIGAVDNYTLFLISPDNIMAYTKTIDGLLPFLNIDGLVIENLESYSLAWSGTIQDDFPEGVSDSDIVSKDLTQHMSYVEPKDVPYPMETIKSILGMVNVYLGKENTLAREAEIKAIPYPDFANMLKSELDGYIDTWNILYPNNQILPAGTLKQDLINAINEKIRGRAR